MELKNPGRKKDPIYEEIKTMVYETRKEHPGKWNTFNREGS